MIELKASSEKTAESGGAWHADAIRGVAFDPTGRFFATAGDDKALRLWKIPEGDAASVAAYECVKCAKANKRLCALSFTDDGKHVMFADKYGDVLVLPTAAAAAAAVAEAGAGAGAAGDKGKDADGDAVTGADTPAFLLGHCCSIITDMTVPRGSNLVCTSDRDHKVRVSNLPTTVSLMEGANEIQSFCHGHTAFVACVASVPAKEGEDKEKQRIVTGGGDGTVRMWRVSDGELLSTVVLAEPYPKEEEEEEEEEGSGGGAGTAGAEEGGDRGGGAGSGSGSGATGAGSRAGVVSGEEPREATKAPAVTAIAAGSDGLIIAVVEGRAELALLSSSSAGMELQTWVPFTGGGQPTAVAFNTQGTRIWAAGISAAEGEGEGEGEGVGKEKEKEGEDGTKDTIQSKQKSVIFVADVVSDAAGGKPPPAVEAAAALAIDAPPSSSRSLAEAMHKKQYDEREGRKKQRNDRTKGPVAAAATNL